MNLLGRGLTLVLCVTSILFGKYYVPGAMPCSSKGPYHFILINSLSSVLYLTFK